MRWLAAVGLIFVVSCSDDKINCVHEQQTCRGPTDCAPGSTCNTALTPAVCATYSCAAVGDPCSEDDLCQKGLRCVSSKCAH
jgi:hypothetical protein